MTGDIKFEMNKNNEVAEITRNNFKSKIDIKDMGGEVRLYFGKNYVEITKKNNYYHINVK